VVGGAAAAGRTASPQPDRADGRCGARGADTTPTRARAAKIIALPIYNRPMLAYYTRQLGHR